MIISDIFQSKKIGAYKTSHEVNRLYEFIIKYKQILNMAREGGIKAVTLRQFDNANSTNNLFLNKEHRHKFIKACHRGFDIAQKSIIKEINSIRLMDELCEDEKFYRELLFRKIADFIAFTLLENKIHVGRRLILHLHPQKADLKNINRDLKEAERLNSESRLTFALLADLTTFIHVFDILRIDFRNTPKIDFIELKSGNVNSIILRELEKFTLDETLPNKIQSDENFPNNYKLQAKRIIKQKLRLQNIHEILQNDSGYDTITGEKFHFSKNEFELESYDRFLNELCGRSMEKEIVSATFQYCIHIGVGNCNNREDSLKNAYEAVKFAFITTLSNNRDERTAKEILSLIRPQDYLKIFNPLEHNLSTTESMPFLAWSLDEEYVMKMIKEDLVILIGFDILSFICIGRKLGHDVRLSSRKKSAETTRKLGGEMVPLWNYRTLEINGSQLLGGFIARLVNHFSSPLQFFNMYS